MKFMNLNLLDAMQKIVNRNNLAYKGDLLYDKEMMEEDAVEGRPQTYIWMSRELGTQMQNVNDFLMKDCHSSVEHFLHESDCPLIFVVEVTERCSLRGNLYELSIPIAQKLRDNAVKAHPMYHYANGIVLTQENKDELSWYEQGQLGKLMQIEYVPDDPFEIKSARTGLRQCCMNMKEGSFEDYLEELERRYKKLHKEWSIKEENILKLKEEIEMLVLPFTVTIRDAKLEIPASEQEVLDFLEAADILYTVEDEDFESPLEIPFFPDELSIDYIEQDVDSDIPVTAEELNDMYHALTKWTNQKALDAGLTYFGAEVLVEYDESEFTFYPANELDDLGSVLVGELYEVPWELIDYIDYESYASDYMMQVEGEVTEYGTIILKD